MVFWCEFLCWLQNYHSCWLNEFLVVSFFAASQSLCVIFFLTKYHYNIFLVVVLLCFPAVSLHLLFNVCVGWWLTTLTLCSRKLESRPALPVMDLKQTIFFIWMMSFMLFSIFMSSYAFLVWLLFCNYHNCIYSTHFIYNHMTLITWEGGSHM